MKRKLIFAVDGIENWSEEIIDIVASSYLFLADRFANNGNNRSILKNSKSRKLD